MRRFLVVGIDPVEDRIPEVFLKKRDFLFEFGKAVVDAADKLDIVGFKPNSAFFEGFGASGIAQLKSLCDYIRQKRGWKIILDAKRGDIGSTNQGYIKYAFEYLRVDGLTVHPFLGRESLQGMLEYSREFGKTLFILCKTSNPGAGELQDLELENGRRLYEYIAQRVREDWSRYGNCGLVVGATYKQALSDIRKIVGNKVIFLSPGVGAQGADLKDTLAQAGFYQNAKVYLPISRAIIYPAGRFSSVADFVRAVRDRIKSFLAKA